MREHSSPEAEVGPVGRFTAWRYEAQIRLAPHVDRTWADAFILELRLRGVPGSAVGDALAEVESHCAESGETAIGAFGDPAAYARSLELPVEPVAPLGGGSTWRWIVQTIGLLLTTSAAASWRADELLEVTVGLAALVTLLVVTMLALERHVDRVMRFMVKRTVAAWALSMLHFGVLVGLVLLLPQRLVSIPAALALLVGVAVLAVGTVALIRHLRGEDVDDPVRASFEASPPDTPRARRRTALLAYGPALLAPAAAVVLVGMWLVLG